MPCVIVRLHNGVIMHCTVCVYTLAAHAHRGLISLSSLVIASEKHVVVPRSSRPTHAGLGTRLPEALLLRMRESLVLETAV